MTGAAEARSASEPASANEATLETKTKSPGTTNSLRHSTLDEAVWRFFNRTVDTNSRASLDRPTEGGCPRMNCYAAEGLRSGCGTVSAKATGTWRHTWMARTTVVAS